MIVRKSCRVAELLMENLHFMTNVMYLTNVNVELNMLVDDRKKVTPVVRRLTSYLT